MNFRPKPKTSLAAGGIVLSVVRSWKANIFTLEK